jgi:mRNA interferase HigB
LGQARTPLPYNLLCVFASNLLASIVRVISQRNLFRKAAKHPDVQGAIQNWFLAARAAQWRSLEDIRGVYPATNMIGQIAIFNISGNHYRLIVRVEFQPPRRVYIKDLLTHAEYDKGAWKKWLR